MSERSIPSQITVLRPARIANDRRTSWNHLRAAWVSSRETLGKEDPLGTAFRLLRDHPGALIVVSAIGTVLAIWITAATDRRLSQRVALIGLAFYLPVLAAITLHPSPVGPDFHHTINISPWSAANGLVRDDESQQLQGLGNLMLFAPLGVLGPMLLGLRVRGVVVVAALVSASVEVGQYLLRTGRAADVDDILLNVAGAAATAFVFARTMRLVGDAAQPRGAVDAPLDE
jgi:VanZ like family